MSPSSMLAVLLGSAGAAAVAGPSAPADGVADCRVVATRRPTVVELYTSEGCSSCPPADRWLSSLKGRPDLLALGFHVNYWDRLGWRDRFSTPAITARQHRLAGLAGEASVYTPQVRVDGADWRGWPQLPAPRGAAREAPPRLELQRHGDRVTVRVEAWPSGRLGAYWAVLEDGHLSRVTAGENARETLRHDHLVAAYQELPEWPAQQPFQAELEVAPGDPERARRVAFVVTDPRSQRPVAAAVIAATAGCR